jgi:hypothetical protein
LISDLSVMTFSLRLVDDPECKLMPRQVQNKKYSHEASDLQH